MARPKRRKNVGYSYPRSALVRKHGHAPTLDVAALFGLRRDAADKYTGLP